MAGRCTGDRFNYYINTQREKRSVCFFFLLLPLSFRFYCGCIFTMRIAHSQSGWHLMRPLFSCSRPTLICILWRSFSFSKIKQSLSFVEKKETIRRRKKCSSLYIHNLSNCVFWVPLFIVNQSPDVPLYQRREYSLF